MMCHPASGAGERGLEGLTAPIPVPGEKLPPNYRRAAPDRSIRFDITYLRQDFSAVLPVENAKPWPEEQRFDFFVRDRLLTPKESATFALALANRDTDGSPYRKAVLSALNGLSGKNLTADEWRKTRPKP